MPDERIEIVAEMSMISLNRKCSTSLLYLCTKSPSINESLFLTMYTISVKSCNSKLSANFGGGISRPIS